MSFGGCHVCAIGEGFARLQGKSGWYFDLAGTLGEVYFYAVDVNGDWWEVVNQREYETRLENACTPMLICQADTKKTMGLSGGTFLEVNHPRAQQGQRVWQENDNGFWERTDKVKNCSCFIKRKRNHFGR